MIRPAAVFAPLLLGACQCGGETDRPTPVPASQAATLVLSELPFAELEVPPHNRLSDEPPPTSIPIEGPFRYVGTSKAGMHKYAAPLPIRPRGLFFHKPQPGMRLLRNGKEIKYDRFGKSQEPMWIHDREELVLYFPNRGKPPEPGVFVLEYPKSTERERQLNLAWSGLAKERFVWTEISDGWDSRQGLLLPAPGVAAWDVTVPPAGELRFTAGVVEPEIAQGPASDGATLVVEVEAAGAVDTVLTDEIGPKGFHPVSVDLSRWAGQPVRLRVRTQPGATATYDYAFLAGPVVASRIEDPVRVVMVFVDTLRPDHLSLYGYQRDTSAALDHLAGEAAVFTNARSVAPWTLPSARTLVTGRQPEHYDAAVTLQQILREQGYATAFFAGNVYLSSNFDMTRDWEFHRVGLWPQAEETTDDALTWLHQNEGRNALLHVHYMSTHLPYVEPDEYRRKYAGEMPPKLREGFQLSDIRKAGIDEDADAQQYVRDRYDNNVRYATDQIARIVAELDDNDVLLLFADHGEELWDHGGFEHGHTLYEELMRVPLVIKAPRVVPRKVDAPVSLLDLTPTILELVGVPVPPEVEGRSLVPLLDAKPGADEPFRARDLAIGRPLYGEERWGVYHGDHKWTTHDGREHLFDLADDPREKNNLLRKDDGNAGAPYRGYLARALGREVAAGYRLVPTNHRGEKRIPGLWALCTVPGGFEHAWKADDPLMNSDATVRTLTDPAQIRAELDRFGFADLPVAEGDGAVEVCWHPGLFGSREVYLQPAEPLEQVGRQLRCAAWYGDGSGGRSGVLTIPADRDPSLVGARAPLARVQLDQRQLALQFGIAPVPAQGQLALEARADEANELLEAMGYVDPEGPEGDEGASRPSGTRCEPPAAAAGAP